MQSSDIPNKIPLPFAAAGAKNTIPVPSQISITPAAASLTDGFPPLTGTPIEAGGKGPARADMNGILYEISAIVRWANAGGGYPYDSTFAADTNVNGYPKGARVLRSDNLGYWFNTVDNNTTDPESAGGIAAGWLPDFSPGATSVTMTSANVTLTPLQYNKRIIVITGSLTANLNLIFPAIAQQWTVINSTTGAFTITCKTASGTGVNVNFVQNIVGDGVNIYNASADAVDTIGQLIATAGGTSDAITATFNPAPNIWDIGLPYFVRATAANTTTTPTFTANSGTLAAKTIVKGAGTALSIGDIAGAGHWLMLQYDAGLDKVVLLNPATFANATFVNLVYTGTLTGGAGILNIDSGKIYKPASGRLLLNTTIDNGVDQLQVNGSVEATAFSGAGTGLTGTANSLNAGLGVNQTWTDVRASRVAGTTYTNSTAKPIKVSVILAITSGSSFGGSLNINGIIVSKQLPGGTTGTAITISEIVPSGGTYSITGLYQASISNWLELR